MLLRIDAQLPPLLVDKFRRRFGLRAEHVFGLGQTRANDEDIFESCREANAILLTKDDDLVRILERRGPPPRVLWITMGNASNAQLWSALEANWDRIRGHFEAGEPLVELSGPRTDGGGSKRA